MTPSPQNKKKSGRQRSKKPTYRDLEKKIIELEKIASEREKALNKAQEIAHLGNWVLDLPTNTFFWSDEAYKIFGLNKDATPEDFWATAHPEDKELQRKVVEDAYYRHKPYDIDHRLIRPDGAVRVVNEQAEVVCDEDGKLVRIIGTVLDITDRKVNEELLKEHRDHLEDLVRERTKNLEEANIALRVLVQGRNEDKIALEERMLTTIRNLVEPYIEEMKKNGLNERQMNCLSLIESNLNDIVSAFSIRLSDKYMNLTPMELKIADLIRKDKTTKDMADLLRISTNAVDFHRKNIRNKLGLKNKKANLKTYLQKIQNQ